jgi:hypothetical protein
MQAWKGRFPGGRGVDGAASVSGLWQIMKTGGNPREGVNDEQIGGSSVENDETLD